MSARGYFVPPMVLLKRKPMIESLNDRPSATPGSVAVNSYSDWMTNDLFLEWLKHIVSQVG